MFLLAIRAIGREEVKGGTLGTGNILPIDIMVFFLSLAYIAISIDASGLIRYLAFRVLSWGGDNGRTLYFYLYSFFFALTSCIGNDPVILSGTAFLAYMTRISQNIKEPSAWIHMQFACANIGSAILVSSNPTNLVLAGAFSIKFIHYTANMIVPTLATAIVLFPFLLWVKFKDEELIPRKIALHSLTQSEGDERRKPVNPNIPHAGGTAEEIKLEEVLNPYLDKRGAWFGAGIMAATLIAILALNAASSGSGSEHPVFWVTLPAAAIVFCFDMACGWKDRETSRPVALRGRHIDLAIREEQTSRQREERAKKKREEEEAKRRKSEAFELSPASTGREDLQTPNSGKQRPATSTAHDIEASPESSSSSEVQSPTQNPLEKDNARETRGATILAQKRARPTLPLVAGDTFWYLQGTFPAVSAVLTHLPWPLIPFAFCMFVLVQALVTKGWVPVFAYGWDHWVNRTGVIGAVGGMGFLSVVLCNFAGTNIGTTILLCRVVQKWVAINADQGTFIPQRTFWATVYSMAVGVNYGAFSTAFSASLAGLLWRDILARKEIKVRALDFAWINLSTIALTMVVGLVVLIGEVYLTRSGTRLYCGVHHGTELDEFCRPV